MSEKTIASSIVYKKYKTYKTYKPKIITAANGKIESRVIDEIFKTEDEAKKFAQQLIEEEISAQ